MADQRIRVYGTSGPDQLLLDLVAFDLTGGLVEGGEIVLTANGTYPWVFEFLLEDVDLLGHYIGRIKLVSAGAYQPVVLHFVFAVEDGTFEGHTHSPNAQFTVPPDTALGGFTGVI